jgi:hypothetical protein
VFVFVALSLGAQESIDMKRWITLAGLFVFLGIAAAQSSPKALPDAPTLLRQLQENQKQIDAIRKNYICTDDEEEYQLDGDGKTKKKDVKQYEFYFVDGFPIKRLLSKEGVALSDSEKKKEDERVAKAEKHAHEHRAKLERGEHWIDEEANQVVRLEAKLLKSQSAGLGLASVKEGTSFVLEQQKINDELWMPSYSDGNIGARVVFKGIRQRNVDRFSNYKKFKSDTRILAVEEVKP